MFSPKCVTIVPMPLRERDAAAANASSNASPGIKRDAVRRTNGRRGARSRSQGLCAPASKTLRITFMKYLLYEGAKGGDGLPGPFGGGERVLADQLMPGLGSHDERGLGRNQRQGRPHFFF